MEPKNFLPHQIREFVRCRDDPIYFINQYIKVMGPTGEISFHMFPIQECVVSSTHFEKMTIIAHGRQTGISTIELAFILHRSIFNSNHVSAIIGLQSKYLLDRLRYMYSKLPEFLQHELDNSNKHHISFSNGSQIIASGPKSKRIRGLALSTVYVNDAAFIQNLEELIDTIYPAIYTNKHSKLIVASVPYPGSHFNKLWNDAKQYTNDFTCIEVPFDSVLNRKDFL